MRAVLDTRLRGYDGWFFLLKDADQHGACTEKILRAIRTLRHKRFAP